MLLVNSCFFIILDLDDPVSFVWLGWRISHAHRVHCLLVSRWRAAIQTPHPAVIVIISEQAQRISSVAISVSHLVCSITLSTICRPRNRNKELVCLSLRSRANTLHTRALCPPARNAEDVQRGKMTTALTTLHLPMIFKQTHPSPMHTHTHTCHINYEDAIYISFSHTAHVTI